MGDSSPGLNLDILGLTTHHADRKKKDEVGLSLNAGNPKGKVRVRIRDKEHGGNGPWGLKGMGGRAC